MNTRLPARFARRSIIPLAAALWCCPPSPSAGGPIDVGARAARRSHGHRHAHAGARERAGQQRRLHFRRGTGPAAGHVAARGPGWCRPACRFLPAAPTGAATSLFLRGANSNQTLFLVDGLRLNDPNTDYAVFLGGAGVSASDEHRDRARSAEHALRRRGHGRRRGGADVKGEGAPSDAVAVEGGSFGTVQGRSAPRGAGNAWAYKPCPEQDDRKPAAEQRLHWDELCRAPRPAVGSADRDRARPLRGFIASYGSPGDRFTNDPDNQEREQNQLATLFAEYTISTVWSGRIMLGGQDRRLSRTIRRPARRSRRRSSSTAAACSTGRTRWRWATATG